MLSNGRGLGLPRWGDGTQRRLIPSPLDWANIGLALRADKLILQKAEIHVRFERPCFFRTKKEPTIGRAILILPRRQSGTRRFQLGTASNQAMASERLRTCPINPALARATR